MIGSFLSRLRRLWRREDGTATIEFVIIFPVFMVLTVSGVEMGILMLRQVMLEHGLDVTVRDLRLGTMTNPTATTVTASICRNAMIIPHCSTVMHLELTPISETNWSVPSSQVTCVNRNSTIAPLVEFNSGQRNEFMLLRACAIFDPLFRTYGLGPNLPLDASGGYRMIASTAFVNEP